jgi:hypothetical protein
MDAPTFKRYVPTEYASNLRVIKEGHHVTYANVSKLESLEEQFKVLTLSLLEDIK